jgi:hypothetical protein
VICVIGRCVGEESCFSITRQLWVVLADPSKYNENFRVARTRMGACEYIMWLGMTVFGLVG